MQKKKHNVRQESTNLNTISRTEVVLASYSPPVVPGNGCPGWQRLSNTVTNKMHGTLLFLSRKGDTRQEGSGLHWRSTTDRQHPSRPTSAESTTPIGNFPHRVFLPKPLKPSDQSVCGIEGQNISQNCTHTRHALGRIVIRDTFPRKRRGLAQQTPVLLWFIIDAHNPGFNATNARSWVCTSLIVRFYEWC